MVLAHSVIETERTEDIRISQSVTFDSMLLTSDTLEGLKSSGFYRPSPIQLHGIPLGKCGFDLLLEAKSGTGKTAVFTIIALEKINLRKGLQAVILAPTREIAAQICDVIQQIGSSYRGLKVEVVMGGLPVHEDIAKFKNKNVHIVVGSPGRLKQLIQEKYIETSAVRLFVLDEADKLLEKSFLLDINYIFSMLPKQKQVIMSSATYPESIMPAIQLYVQSVQHIRPDSNSILLGVEQNIVIVKYNANIVKQTKHRFEELLKILSSNSFKQCLIFCNYQARIAELHKMLTREKWPAEQLYGQQEQTNRLDALKSLQQYKCRILICTDLAARGIDASNVDLVVNFEPPYDWQTYLHRIGRAGRFGSHGIAITILSEGKEQSKFIDILKTIKGPSNLKHLWDDDDCAQNSSIDTSSTLNLKLEPKRARSITVDEHNKIWSALTNCNEVDSQILSFNNLNESFEKPEIESFEDLLLSAKSHQQNSNAKDTYQHLKMQVSYMEYSKLEEGTKEKPPPNIARKEVIENKNCNENILIPNTALENKIKSLNTNNECNKFSPEEDVPKLNADCNYEYETLDMSDALRSAGLPVEFCSAKDKRIKENELKKYHAQNKDEYQYQHRTKPTYLPNKEAHHRRIEDTLQNTVHDATVKDQMFQNTKKRGSFNKKCVTSKNRGRHYRNISSDESTSYTSSNSSDSEVNVNYYNWYNSLKFRVKQLEFAIYMDEMLRK